MVHYLTTTLIYVDDLFLSQDRLLLQHLLQLLFKKTSYSFYLVSKYHQSYDVCQTLLYDVNNHTSFWYVYYVPTSYVVCTFLKIYL